MFSFQILKQSVSLKLLPAHHCTRITGKLIKSTFLGHISKLRNQNFGNGACKSEFLTSSPDNNPEVHQSLRTNNLDAGIEKIGWVVLHSTFEYKAQIGSIPRLSTHEKEENIIN